ncbi:hypothetical protein [Micromonospora psammae]|uniref:hypothetical protein n=1 Tax=Micromonospora sp. CPCC 205556 TaxID=3122398 RepID=UPI002FF1A2B5
MLRLDVRRLAAIDMYGSVGSRVRRWVILAEFVLGVAGCLAVGGWVASGGQPTHVLLGGWLALVGLNYVPLTLHTVSLLRPGALDRELAGVDIAATLRHYTLQQLWIFVPLLLVVLAARQVSRR